MATRIWQSSCLCGCEVELTAEWKEWNDPTIRYPIPGTIEKVGEFTCCEDHKPWLTEPLPIDPYFGSHGYLYASQFKGTEAERLFVRHFVYTAQLAIRDCGCKIYQLFNRQTGEFLGEKPERSEYCERHTR